MKAITSVSFILIGSLLLSSCSQKMNFVASTAVPAATGSVNVKKDNNGNYTVTVNTLNLAEAKKLTPPRNTYIVWMENNRSAPKKLGQINTGSGLFSKALRGELKTTTTEKPDRVFITAEDDSEVLYPGSQQVLTTN